MLKAPPHITTLRLLVCLFLGAIFTSCSNEKVTRTKPYVVSTTTLLKDLADTLWGEQIDSVSLMGPGIDPHLYQPTAQDLKKLEEADFILAHGLHLEGKMVEAIESLSRKKKVFILGDHIDKSKLIHFEGNFDPHIWFDPELWIASAQALSKYPIVKTNDPSRLIHFEVKVREIVKNYTKKFSSLPAEQKILITSHDAFHYLGRAFSLEVKGVQGLSTDSEVGIKKIEELVTLIKDRKVKAIFSETSVSSRSIDKLTSETNVKRGGTLYSDALGDNPGPAGTYLGMLEHNLSTIYEALK